MNNFRIESREKLNSKQDNNFKMTDLQVKQVTISLRITFYRSLFWWWQDDFTEETNLIESQVLERNDLFQTHTSAGDTCFFQHSKNPEAGWVRDLGKNQTLKEESQHNDT